jgi:hypothetical protein
MTTPPPLSIKDLSDSQHRLSREVSRPTCPALRSGCRGSFPPYQKWIPITAGDKSFVPGGDLFPGGHKRIEPSRVPSHAREASRPSARSPTLRASGASVTHRDPCPSSGVPTKTGRTTTACVHAPKLHFTRGSSNPIARFRLGVETKLEFPTILAPRLGSLEKALRRSRDQRTAEQAEPDARETVRAFDVCSLQCPRFTNKLHCERKSLI